MRLFKREPTYGEYIRQDPDYIKALRRILKKNKFPKKGIEFNLGNCRYCLEEEGLAKFTLGGDGLPLIDVTSTKITVNGTTVWQK